MISSTTAALVVSVAKGVIKLGHRLDGLLAEKAAVSAGLVLAMPDFYDGPGGVQKVRELREFLARTQGRGGPDPLGDDRSDLERELAKSAPDNALVGACYRRVFPERLEHATFSPDAAYVAEIRKRLPSFDLGNEDNLAAAFSFSAGKDERGLGYGARVGLLIADVVAEYGAEHAARFVRDPGAGAAMQAVLERFARPDLEKFTEWSPLLRHALSATLNGLLDARTALAGDSPWLARLLDVLAEARENPAGGENFLFGLLRGQGYPLLISLGLSRAAETLAEDQADAFKLFASDVLKSAAPLAAASARFGEFFSDHWGDLLRAGLQSIERQGPALLGKQPELLRNVLVGMVRELNEIPQAALLSSETLFHLGDAAIAAVAANPALLAESIGGKPWLRVVLESFVNTIDHDGLGHSLSRAGLDAIVTDAAGVIAQHPELLGSPKNAGLMREVAGGIFQAVSELPGLSSRQIATAATGGALRAIAAHPDLLGTRYAPLVAEFSARLGQLVREQTLTGLDAAALVSVVIETLLANPALFVTARSNLATATLDAVLLATKNDPARLLAGANRLAAVREVLANLARHGKIQFESLLIAPATAQLQAVIEDALAHLADELGRTLDLPGVPRVVGEVVGAWARGEFKQIDPASPAFRALLGNTVLAAAGVGRISP